MFRNWLAEREGFEPPIGLHLCRISSAVRSTTLPPLQGAMAGGSAARVGGVLGEDDEADKAGGGKTATLSGHLPPQRSSKDSPGKVLHVRVCYGSTCSL